MKRGSPICDRCENNGTYTKRKCCKLKGEACKAPPNPIRPSRRKG